MNNTALTKLWSAVALYCLYCAVNGIGFFQGLPFQLPPFNIAETSGKAVAATVYYPLLTVPLIMFFWVTRAHIGRNSTGAVAAAWPVMLNRGLLMTDPMARAYQYFWMFLLLLLPLYGSFFLLNEVFELHIGQRGIEQELNTGGWISHLTTIRCCAGYIVRNSEDNSEASYYPGLESIVYFGFLLWACYLWFRILRELCQIARQRT